MIYKFAQNYHLDLEQYYDVLAIGLCRAALSYKKSSGYQFSTYAFTVMKNEYLNTYRSQYGCKRNDGNKYLVSYNGQKFSESVDVECEMLDFIGVSDEEMIDDIIFSIIENDLVSRFDKPEHKQMARLLLNGFSQSEISQIMDVSRTMVYHIRKKLKNMYSIKFLRRESA